MKFKMIYRLVVACIATALSVSSCETNAEYADWTERVTPVRTSFLYMADSTVRYAVEYGGVRLMDTIPYYDSRTEKLSLSADISTYLRSYQLNDILRVYRLGNGDPVLELEQELNIYPIIVPGTTPVYSTIGLLQLRADEPVQYLDMNYNPTDSALIATRFFYADERLASGADSVRISVLAVDQYSLLMKLNRLENVPDSMKTVVKEFTLAPAKLSENILLNTCQYADNKGLSPRFLYRISDASTGAVIQDYKLGGNAATTAEIKFETEKRNDMPYPIYKSSVMRWTYQSEEISFASPTELIKGNKWTGF